MQQDRSERKILLGFSFIGLFWLLDVILDAFVFNGTETRTRQTNGVEEAAIHACFLMLQLGLIIYTWRVFEKRARIADTLNEALGQAHSEKSRYEAVVAAMGDGISIQDRNFRILYQNRVHQELVGGDCNGGLCYREYGQLDSVCSDCPVELSFRDGQVHRQEKMAGPGVSATHVEITASPLRDSSGEIVAGIELVRNISDRKSAEEALSRQSAFLQMLMDTIPLPVFYKNAKGFYISCNKAFEDKHGISKEDLAGKSIFDIAPAELARIYFAHDLALLEQGGTRIYEEVMKFADGELHDLVIHKAVYNGTDGTPDGIVGVLVDVTEQNKWKYQIETLNADLSRNAVELEAANRDLESFSYSASHDLRNPLSKISASAQLLDCEYSIATDERYSFLVRTILESCDKMDSLIDDLLTLAQTSKSEVVFVPVDLSAVAGSTALDIRLSEPERMVIITIEPDMHAVCSANLIRIVLENLLNNAWKYSRLTPQPVISFGRIFENGETVYFVKDNGAGFDMGCVDQLFRPFQRLHGTAYPGTGIGLATVQRIINRHGGRVWAEGTVGAGATFYFTLASA